MSPLASADAPHFHPWRPLLGTSPSPPEASPDITPVLFFFPDNCGIKCQPGSARHQKVGAGGWFSIMSVWFRGGSSSVCSPPPHEGLGMAGPGLALLPDHCVASSKPLPPQTLVCLSQEGEAGFTWWYENQGTQAIPSGNLENAGPVAVVSPESSLPFR